MTRSSVLWSSAGRAVSVRSRSRARQVIWRERGAAARCRRRCARASPDPRRARPLPQMEFCFPERHNDACSASGTCAGSLDDLDCTGTKVIGGTLFRLYHLPSRLRVFACPLLSYSREDAKTRSPDGCSQKVLDRNRDPLARLDLRCE